ncbi:periplasmic heavy metal sensor [Thermodesulfobacteriota bacterium]
MKKGNLIKGLMIVAAVSMIGLGATAYADWGRGYGHHGWGMEDSGMGYGHRGRGMGYNRGYMPDLSEEELAKVDEERNAFFKDTESLKQNMYQKNLELRSELAKENPDAKKASSLQKEISDLESQFAQKRLDHMLRMKKINPDTGTKGMRSQYRGSARSGYSSRGGCW